MSSEEKVLQRTVSKEAEASISRGIASINRLIDAIQSTWEPDEDGFDRAWKRVTSSGFEDMTQSAFYAVDDNFVKTHHSHFCCCSQHYYIEVTGAMMLVCGNKYTADETGYRIVVRPHADCHPNYIILDVKKELKNPQ